MLPAKCQTRPKVSQVKHLEVPRKSATNWVYSEQSVYQAGVQSPGCPEVQDERDSTAIIAANLVELAYSNEPIKLLHYLTLPFLFSCHFLRRFIYIYSYVRSDFR